MEIEHAKKVLNAMLEGCEDVKVITSLIDLAWEIINEKPKSIPLPPPEKKEAGPKQVHINGRTFRSIKAACQYYNMMGEYTSIVQKLRNGAFPRDLFPSEQEPRRKKLPTDRSGNVKSIADVAFEFSNKGL